MRLIDADELKKKFSERSYWTYTHENGDAIPIGWIMSGIDHAPTVEERPQGEWTIVNDVYCECSFCKNKEVKFSKYCPECGAEMRKGDES